MEAREETEANNHSGNWVVHDSRDDVLDSSDEDDCGEDMGSI